MALSEPNQLKISQILEVPASDLTIWLDAFTVSTNCQTAIESQLTLWDAAATKTTALYPTESNKGVKTNPDASRGLIRKNIAMLLERPDWASGSGNYLPRG